MLNALLKNRIMSFFISTFLLLAAIIITFVYLFNYDLSPTVLSHEEAISGIKHEGNVIQGEFTASENYLGLITLQLEKNSPKEGESVFQLKDKIRDDWYHVATIPASHYFYQPLYSFGFPIIEKSKDKTYQFRIVLSSEKDEIKLDKDQKKYYTGYSFPKKVLLSDQRIFKDFIAKKVLFYIFRPEFWTVFIIYLLPFFSYVSYICLLRKSFLLKAKNGTTSYLRNLSKPLIITPILLIFADIFILRTYSEKLILVTIAFILLAIFTHRLKHKLFFGAATLLLVYTPFLLILPMEWVGEKSSIWAFLMLVIGTACSAIEISKFGFYDIKYLKAPTEFIRLVFQKIDFSIEKITIRFMNAVVDFTVISITRLPTNLLGWIRLLVRFFIVTIICYFLYLTSLNILSNIRYAYQKYAHNKTRLSLNPHVDKIEPYFVYKGTKVVIYGRSFGWDENATRIYIDDQIIVPEILTDSEIIFTIPLHWKIGEHDIRLEKTFSWDGSEVIAKNNVGKIKILPVGENYNDDDNKYFEQLKNLRRKTLILNGYE